MSKPFLGLINFFEGYVRNYRNLKIHQVDNTSKFTKKEIDFFADLGEKLGYFTFIEDPKFDNSRNRSRPMDLAWWKADEKDKENFTKLILHLERESSHKKDTDTIDKLFSDTHQDFIPKCVIGIQNIERVDKINQLKELVIERNKKQQSNVLMVYRFFDVEKAIDRVWAYQFDENGLIKEGERKAVCFMDKTKYWSMCFDWEFYLDEV